MRSSSSRSECSLWQNISDASNQAFHAVWQIQREMPCTLHPMTVSAPVLDVWAGPDCSNLGSQSLLTQAARWLFYIER